MSSRKDKTAEGTVDRRTHLLFVFAVEARVKKVCVFVSLGITRWVLMHAVLGESGVVSLSCCRGVKQVDVA